MINVLGAFRSSPIQDAVNLFTPEEQINSDASGYLPVQGNQFVAGVIYEKSTSEIDVLTLIGMMDQPGFHSALKQRHVQPVEH